jgi:hypothetical protein
LLDAIWPRESLQSNAALRVLQFMEDDGLIPESSTHAVLLEVCNCCKLLFVPPPFS